MSQPPDGLAPLSVENDDELTVEDVIHAYLQWVDTPSSAEIESLGQLLGYGTEEFEKLILSMFDESNDVEDNEEDDTEDDESDDLNPQDLFIISYFLHQSDPSDEQINQLVSVLGISNSELEERLLTLLSDDEEDED